MRGRLSIVAGLIVGVVAGGLLLGGIVALGPDDPARTTAAPSRGPATPSPSVVASARPTAVAGASAVASDGAFHVGQPAPAQFWIDSGGSIRDGALGGIGPGVMVAGLKTILPGIDVTP